MARFPFGRLVGLLSLLLVLAALWPVGRDDAEAASLRWRTYLPIGHREATPTPTPTPVPRTQMAVGANVHAGAQLLFT